MAKASFKVPDSLTEKFESLGRESGEMIDKCVKSGADLAYEHVWANLSAALSDDHKNGELINALGVSPVKVDANGIHNAKVGFNEPRQNQPRGTRRNVYSLDENGNPKKRTYYEQTNAMIATVLEYGRAPNKNGKAEIKPRGFIKQAKIQSNDAVISLMNKIFDEEAEKA